LAADPGSAEILAPGPGSRPIGGSMLARPDAAVPAEVVLAFHPRTLAQLLYLRAGLDPDDPNGSVHPGDADRHPPWQERELPLRRDAELLQHGPALRP